MSGARVRCPVPRRVSAACQCVTLLVILLCWVVESAAAASFTTRNIGQTNPLAGASNRITITLVADESLAEASGSQVTITGLDNAVVLSPVTLLDAGDDGETIFSDGATQSRGAWSSGTLTLSVHSSLTLQNGTAYTFAFEIRNPSVAQSAPTVAVAASGSAAMVAATMTAPNAIAKGVTDGANVLYVVAPTFSSRSIQQSTPVSGEANTIHVSLQANCDLESASTVTLSGLTGADTVDNAGLSITTSPTAHFGTTAAWTQDGKLVLTSVGTSAATTYSISFVLTNPSTTSTSSSPQLSANVEAGTHDAVVSSLSMTTSSDSLYGVPNGLAPLTVLVPALSLATIQQDSPVPGATNLLTISLTANYNLYTGSLVIDTRSMRFKFLMPLQCLSLSLARALSLSLSPPSPPSPRFLTFSVALCPLEQHVHFCYLYVHARTHACIRIHTHSGHRDGLIGHANSHEPFIAHQQHV